MWPAHGRPCQGRRVAIRPIICSRNTPGRLHFDFPSGGIAAAMNGHHRSRIARMSDYEHGALLYGLERSAIDSIRRAEVLFVGNSRLQAGFSTKAVRDYFNAINVRFCHGIWLWRGEHVLPGSLKKMGS